ncbi:MAG: cohesin domain-containing protein [Patescibacteria group bacterium]
MFARYKKILPALIFLLTSFVFVPAASAATLYLSPPSGEYRVGQSFTLSVNVSSPNQAVNAADGRVSFPKDYLEILNLSKSGSILSYWISEPVFSNLDGSIKFEGVIPNPGFTGAAGRLLAATFRVKRAGTAALNFVSGSVLANDGQGTNVLDNLTGANFVLTTGITLPPIITPPPTPPRPPAALALPAAPAVTSETHSDPEKWYQDNNPKFAWPFPAGITGVNFVADHDPDTNPGTRSDGLMKSYQYKNVADGRWYFHLRLQNAGGWGGTTHFGFNIDTTPPTDLQIIPVEREAETVPQVAFTITAADSGSGIDYYEISVDNASSSVWRDSGDHQFVAPRLESGGHTLSVKVYDQAGNVSAGQANFSIAELPSPRITDYPREIESGELITIRGEAAAGSLIILRLTRPDGSDKLVETRADEQGRFVILIDEKLPAEVYTATAVARSDDGAESAPSESISFSVFLSAFWQWGNELLRWLSLIVPILALLLILILLILSSYYRIRHLKQTVRRESREAAEALHKAFDFLRQKSCDQLALLEAAKAKRVLTKEEASLVESLKQNLNDVEAFVRKEIGDIEKTVD